MASIKGKGALENDFDVIVEVYDNKRNIAGKNNDISYGVASLNRLGNPVTGEPTNEGQGPQHDTRLYSKASSYKDKQGKEVETVNHEQYFAKSAMDSLAACPSQPLVNKEGQVVGTAYSAKAKLVYMGEKEGFAMATNSIKPGVPLPQNVKAAMIEKGAEDRAFLAEQRAASKGAAKEAPAKETAAKETTEAKKTTRKRATKTAKPKAQELSNDEPDF